MKLSVVAPTYNERENVGALVEQVRAALVDTSYEIIIADDDSPDLTWQVAQEISASDSRVRVLRRTQKPGLAAAVIDGFTFAEGDIVVCMDADLQHDPGLLPKMVEELLGGADVVVGSRYVSGGSSGNWSWLRRLESLAATKMAQLFLRVNLRDPMSGFFMMCRDDFLRVRPSLKGEGFKILLEILVKLRPRTIAEVPYTFRTRQKGESKLSSGVVLLYLQQLWELSCLEPLLPVRFTKFALVGASGIIVNLAVMALLLGLAEWRGWGASAVASVVANLSNYCFNNIWTFSDRIRSGLDWMKGYVSYLVMSMAGLGITTAAYAAFTWVVTRFAPPKVDHNAFGILLACQLLAILLGVYVNYALNKTVTWRTK